DLKHEAGDRYSGTIHLGEKSFPLTATATDGGLSGTFESGGRKYSFEARLADGQMTFRTGKTKYVLKPQKSAGDSDNLLDQEQPNPLERGKGKPDGQGTRGRNDRKAAIDPELVGKFSYEN